MGAQSLPTEVYRAMDVLRRAHDAKIACLVVQDAYPVWSRDDPAPQANVVDQAVIGATWALSDGGNHVLRGENVVVAAGNGRQGCAVLFGTSTLPKATIDSVTADVRNLLSNYQVGRSEEPPPLKPVEEPRGAPAWLVPKTVEGVAFSFANAAAQLTGHATAVVVRDPAAQTASVVAVSEGADRRLLRTIVAPTSAAGRACMGDVTTTGAGATDLLGGVRSNRRQRQEGGIALSLRHGREGVGSLVVFGNHETMDPRIQDRLQELAREGGPVLGRAVTSQNADRRGLVDDVTGQPNQQALERAMREHTNGRCAVVCVDIDQFHELERPIADAALRHVARVVRGQLREYDVPARIGGLGFVLFLPHTALHHAFGVADRVRIAVHESVFDFGEKRDLTCSCGVAAIPDTVESVEDLLSAADSALEEAKAAGENRVVAAKRR
ncbi:MAG: GGDEF domain-containing protein [Gemmatimonadetes bacterium]|nr:GGDEF domain-containing protein [Gemmatimonadota bacterium]